jgi:ribosomal protein S18 acetylase RimI-like enzyme
MDIYSKEDIENSSLNRLRRILYWTEKHTINNICDAIMKWTQINNFYEIDNQCGVSEKGKGKEEKEMNFAITEFIPKRDKENKVMKDKKADIVNLVNDAYGIDNFVIPEDDSEWIVAYKGKNIVAVLSITTKGRILYLAMNEKYRRQNIGKTAIKKLFSIIHEKSRDWKLSVSITDSNYKKICKLYTSYGMVVKNTDNDKTYFNLE